MEYNRPMYIGTIWVFILLSAVFTHCIVKSHTYIVHENYRKWPPFWVVKEQDVLHPTIDSD